jgi:hypothetical protein
MVSMNSISVKIASLLQKYNFKDEAQNYLKNINGCVVDLLESICDADTIVNSAYGKKYISRGESRKLQKQCREILEAVYIFKERLKTFSTKTLRDKGINLNPSFNPIFQEIILARGALTHIREPFYTYRTANGSYACAACDVAPNSYQGGCLNILVEYREQDGTVILSCEIKTLLRHIKNGVMETLTKYYGGLERHMQ